MRIILFILSISICLNAKAARGWLCREASSVRSGNTLTTCGIGLGKTEAEARSQGLKLAYKELDAICSRSIDCKDQELYLEPLRNECVRDKNQFKCYRALLATITKTKKHTKDKSVIINKIIKVDTKEEEYVSKYQCSYSFSKVNKLLKDNKVKEAVRNIKKIPFRLKCSQLHFRFMNILVKLKKYPRDYLNYLYSLLGTFGDNWDDARPVGIFSYLHTKGDWSKREWKLLYDSIKEGNDRDFSRISSIILHPRSKNLKLQKMRLDGIAEDLIRERLGFPKPIVPDQALLRMTRNIRDSETFWVIDKIFSTLVHKIKKFKNKRDLLRRLAQFFNSSDFSDIEKQKIQSWMALVLKRDSFHNESQDFYMSYINSLDQKIGKLDPTIEEEEEVLKKLVLFKKNFLSLTKDYTNLIFSKVKKKHKKKRIILFCLEQKIDCLKITPSLKSLKRRLGSKNKKTLEDVTEILAKMPDNTFLLKDELLKLLTGRGKRRIQANIIEALLNTPIKAKNDIDTILKHSWNRVYSYEEVVDKLGKRVLVSLIPIIMDNSHKHQRLAIDMVGSLGREALSTKKILENLIKSKVHYSVKNSAKAALDKIN